MQPTGSDMFMTEYGNVVEGVIDVINEGSRDLGQDEELSQSKQMSLMRGMNTSNKKQRESRRRISVKKDSEFIKRFTQDAELPL